MLNRRIHPIYLRHISRFILILGTVALSACQTTQDTKQAIAKSANANNADKLEFTGYSPAPSEKLKENWYRLIGTWQGNYDLSNNQQYQWQITHHQDGRFELTTKWLDDGELIKQADYAGAWGVDKTHYFNITNVYLDNGEATEINLSGPHHHEIYRIIELNKDEFIYEHTDSGIRFKSKKLSPDFE